MEDSLIMKARKYWLNESEVRLFWILESKDESSGPVRRNAGNGWHARFVYILSLDRHGKVEEKHEAL